MAGSRVRLKPEVFKDEGYWVALLDHDSWWESEDFGTWDEAIDYALQLGLSAGVWSLDG